MFIDQLQSKTGKSFRLDLNISIEYLKKIRSIIPMAITIVSICHWSLDTGGTSTTVSKGVYCDFFKSHGVC